MQAWVASRTWRHVRLLMIVFSCSWSWWFLIWFHLMFKDLSYSSIHFPLNLKLVHTSHAFSLLWSVFRGRAQKDVFEAAMFEPKKDLKDDVWCSCKGEGQRQKNPDFKDKLTQTTSTSICNRAIHTLGTRDFFSRTGLSAAETFRGRPKAEAMSDEAWVTIKTWQKPETRVKSLWHPG